MGLKKNLYYEIKDKVVEERQDGIHAYKQKVRVKEYGLNSSKEVRKTLIDILIDRVESHKDKIISPIIYNELLGMEIKRNGKVEHSNSTHDDQIFSMLMALYVWYEGVNLAERYGIKKTSIRTDEDIDEEINYYDDESVEIVDSFNSDSEINQEIQQDLDSAIKAGGQLMQDFIEKRRLEEKEKFNALLNTPIGEKAYREMYNIPKNIPISNFTGADRNQFQIPDSVFNNFYNSNSSVYDSNFDTYGYPNIQTVPEGQISLLEDDDYKYTDYFNF